MALVGLVACLIPVLHPFPVFSIVPTVLLEPVHIDTHPSGRSRVPRDAGAEDHGGIGRREDASIARDAGVSIHEDGIDFSHVRDVDEPAILLAEIVFL
jgi:hypothetical protein